jgi:hypothetical protein
MTTRQIQLTKMHTRKTTPRKGKQHQGKGKQHQGKGKQHQTTNDVVVGPELKKKTKVLQADI